MYTGFSIENHTYHEIPDHELLLAFNSDADAEAFNDWLAEQGRAAFAAWYTPEMQNGYRSGR